jgi:glycosyltransferase 2 family protein
MTVTILLWLSDFKSVWTGLRAVKSQVVMAAVFMQLITIFIINYQWKMLCELVDKKPAFIDIIRLNMKGTFIETITPGVKMGGELARVYMFKSQLGFSVGKATAIVGVQKTISLTSFAFLNLLGLGYFFLSLRSNGSLQGSVIAAAFLFILLLAGGLILTLCYPQIIDKVVKKLPFSDKIKNKLEFHIASFTQALTQIRENKAMLIFHFLISLFIWAFFAFKTYYIAHALGIKADFLSLAAVTYLTYMVGMVPLMPGGLGSFEGSMVFLMIPLGVSIELGMILTLVVRFVTFWFVFILSIAFMLMDALVKLFIKKLSGISLKRVCK